MVFVLSGLSGKSVMDIKQIRGANASLSSTAVDFLPITNSIMTDHSLFSVRQDADVPVDNVWDKIAKKKTWFFSVNSTSTTEQNLNP